MNTIQRHLLLLAATATIVLVAFFIGLKLWGYWYDEWSGYNASVEVSDGVCNIAVVKIAGDLLPYASEDERLVATVSVGDEVVKEIDYAEGDWNIDGVLLQVDSYGGAISPASEIADRLEKLEMPSAAYLREAGTSAAYLASVGADTIIATPFADVGSIGVTMSYLDLTRQNEEAGIEFVSLSSGKYKDYGSPDRPLTPEERALLERDLDIYHRIFIERVAAARSLPVEDVTALADGSSMPGTLALERKLVDQVGNADTVRAWFAEQLEMPLEEVILCD